MTNRQRSSLLTTLVLVAAMSLVLGSAAQAAPSLVTKQSSVSSLVTGKSSKPGASPTVGEPDSPSGAPLPPKLGPYPTGGSTLGDWTLRLQWLLRSLLLQSPKRFP